MDWPYDTLDLLADGKVSKAVDGLLGDQVEKFRKTGPKVRDAVALMEAIAGASGGELGN
uniref:Uncharacterized protein n=1 Tax=Nonomuraea gerenzanensis TaxID=93944 RepID=A0A1M4DVH2_9ACTN|nr:hypothetical protein BN4615_P80 [Nonomuraea gerenzanensis]